MTDTPKSRERDVRLRSAWDLPDLIRPLPKRRRPRLRRPRLLPHYPAVVEFIYNHRYATGFQVRDRLGEYMRSERTCQYQLAALVQLGYLGVAPVRSTSPNFPNVYFATGKGVRLVREEYERLGRMWSEPSTEAARAKAAALESVLHEVCLTQFAIDVRKAIDNREDLEQLFAERRYFRVDRQLRFTYQGRRRTIIPDFGFMLRSSNPPLTAGASAKSVSPTHLLHFVELDNGTRSLSSVRRQLRQYDLWARSDDARKYLSQAYVQCGERVERLRFRLLLIAQAKDEHGADDRRLTELFIQALELPSALRDRIWLTTAETLRREPRHSPLPADAVWLRVRDARRWLADYRAEVQTSPERRNRSHERQRAFVSAKLGSLPRHPLFSHGSGDASP